MSTSIKAKLFYGYIKPVEYNEEDKDTISRVDLPWSNAHTKSTQGCTVDLYGSDGNLGYFLAVKESLHEAEPWDGTNYLDLIELAVQSLDSPWDEMLRRAAMEFGINLTGLTSGWYLACLYF